MLSNPSCRLIAWMMVAPSPLARPPGGSHEKQHNQMNDRS